jgi:hypothetical protein
MLRSSDTKLRRAAVLFAAVGLIALVAIPIAAGKPIPSPNGPYQTVGSGWTTKGSPLDVQQSLLRKSLPTQQDIQTAGLNWAAKASLLDVNGNLLRQKLPSAQDISTQGSNWAAKGRLLNVNGGLSKDVQSEGSGSGSFHWNEFGIGAGAMLALVLLLGVAAIGIRVVHSGSLSQGRTA